MWFPFKNSVCVRQMLCLLLCGWTTCGWANNVKVAGDIQINPFNIKADGIATVNFTLEWDNSWRDDFNNDAVYFFLKYKTKTQNIWRHAYLTDKQENTVGGGFEYKLSNSTGAKDKNEGIFIQRQANGTGRATVKVSLKWDIASNPLEPLKYDNFETEVTWAGMGIEMVFIPRGAYQIGDNYSEKSFKHKELPFPAELDVTGTQYYLYSKDPVNINYPPSNAVNHINDITRTNSNAWVGNGTTMQQWMIDFCHAPDGVTKIGEKKTIKYIGISGLFGCIPGKWELQGSNDYTLANNWTNLHAGTGTMADWDSSMLRVYPPAKVLKLANPGAYCYYRISIEDMSPAVNAPVIKTVAMTESELGNLMDSSVVIDRAVTLLGGADGMMADDTDTWSGQTGEEYPNGYKGFYVMKYEVSQEQYVEFLNKLTYVQQKARSIGDALDALPLKAYLFGTTPTAPSQRNGIVLITREAGLPLTFACNLNTADGGHSLGGDGQAVACNFLSIADMLAYADWCGLRPLTEMEYEKMSRRPYPQKPERGEYAWGSKDGLVFPAGLQNEGRKDEKMQAGNVNIGQIVPGPVRCGIFAGGGTKQMAAGSSFWGVMDLCGNLAEMYYTVNTAGRGFRDYQGNGELPATGAADMSAYWPSNADAVGVRGGSYQSGTGETATSARGNATKYFKSLIERSSEVSFRLGRSVAGSNLSSILTAANGKNTEMGIAFDTICSGEDYRIQGNSDLQGATYYTYIWYSSENEGKTWERMGGEEGKDLCVRGLKNIGMEDRMLKKYWYKRKVITPQGDGESNAVAVSVVDDSYRIDRLKDTVTIFDETNGIRVWTKNKTTFEWTGMSTGAKIAPKQEDEKYSYLLPTRATFITAADKNLFGVKVVDLKMTIAATCTHNEAIELFFPDAVDTKVIGLLDHQDGYKLWSDGTFAASADEYRHPKPPYRYTGKTGSGVYRIDPDGPGSMAPFNVYCDMETDGGGWMLAGKFTNSDARYWSADKNSWTDQTSRGSFTNITATADAKTPVWGGCPVKYMMFQNMGNTQKAFKTTTLLKDTGPVTLSSFFTEMLADFPNPSGSAYMKTLNISFLTSAYNDFPWINQSGFRAGQIVIGKSSGSRSQGVISGTMANGIYDVCGLGALGYYNYTAPVFGNGSYRADVGWGSDGASAERNVLLFVK